MRLTLIKPNMGRCGQNIYIDEGRMEPLQLGILAALTPPQVEVKLYDDRCEPIPYEEPTDLAAITVETFTAKRAYEIAAQYRARGVPVVLGGMHPTLLPSEAAQYADSVILGDAEPVWAQVIADAARGKLAPRYQGGPQEFPQQGIMARRDLFWGKGYLPITLLQFSRGCKYGCTFCASSAYFHKRHFCRRVEEVVAEIQSQRRKLLFFVDDNIVADFDKAKQLFRALIPLRVRWVSQGSLDMLEDPELMQLMVQSGCLGLVIGFESIKQESLLAMHKAANQKRSWDRYRHAVSELRAWGLQTWAAFTVGHDADTIESIHETCQFALENKFCFAAFNILMPYPGTPLYQQLAQEGRLLYDGKWWLHPEYRFNYAAFQPKNMTPGQLTETAFWCRRRFNSPSSIIWRALEPHTNLRTPYRFMTYLLYNPLFRKEVFKKQGMQLGVDRKETKHAKPHR